MSPTPGRLWYSQCTLRLPQAAMRQSGCYACRPAVKVSYQFLSSPMLLVVVVSSLDENSCRSSCHFRAVIAPNIASCVTPLRRVRGASGALGPVCPAPLSRTSLEVRSDGRRVLTTSDHGATHLVAVCVHFIVVSFSAYVHSREGATYKIAGGTASGH